MSKAEEFLLKKGYKPRYKLRNPADRECSPEDPIPYQLSFYELQLLLEEYGNHQGQ